MTAQQARWAAQHDWYVCTSGQPHTGLTVHVIDSYTDRDGHNHVESLQFTDFQALRAWAGY